MKTFRLGLVVLIAMAVSGCKNASATNSDKGIVALEGPLDTLKAGNERFVAGRAIHSNQSAERRTEVAAGQHPIAIVVGCADSRVPPEIVFDQGVGDLFVVRVAGNIVDDHALGSIEYAVEHLHAPLIIVLGHDKCGAVQAAVSGGDAGAHIQSIVEAIKPAVDEARSEQGSSPGGDLLDHAIDANVRHVVYEIQHSEPILEHEIEAGKLQVVGARYKLESGKVEFFGDDSGAK